MSRPRHRSSEPGWLSLLAKNRPFSLFWSAGLLSATGTWLQNVAAALILYEMTESTFWVGLGGFAVFGPSFLFSIPAGVLADRYSRRTIIVVTHLAGLATATVITLLTVFDRLTPEILLVGAFVIGTAYATSKPAMVSLLPALVPRSHLRQAVAANSSQFMLAQVIGPGVAGVVVAGLGYSWAFGFNALSFFGIVLVMPFVARGIPGTADGSGASAATDRPRLWSYLREQRHLRQLMTVVATSNWLTEGVRTIAPVYAVVVLGANEAAAGWMISGYGIGAVSAVLFFGGSMNRRPPLKAGLLGFALTAVGFVSLALAPSVHLAIASASLIGIGHFMASTTATSLIQETVDDAIRGRIMSVHSMAVLGIRPFSALAMGSLAIVSIRWAVGIWMLSAAVGVLALSRLASAASGWNRWDSSDRSAESKPDAPVLVPPDDDGTIVQPA